jgi:hypothetical protein
VWRSGLSFSPKQHALNHAKKLLHFEHFREKRRKCTPICPSTKICDRLRRARHRDSEIVLGDLEQKEVNSSPPLYPQQIKLRGIDRL